MVDSEAPPSTIQLLDAAVGEALSAEGTDEAYWDAVVALRRVPLHAVWPRLVVLAIDARAPLRELVPDVLRGLAECEPSLLDSATSLLAQRLREEREPSVLVATLHALGELEPTRRVELILPLLGHHDALVREAAVIGMAGARTPEAIGAFILASGDAVDSVRDWATFELGTQLGDEDDPSRDDLPGVLEALLARLDDAHVDTRCEALVGLARRGDRRVIPALRHAIENGVGSSLELDAIRMLAASELGGPLQAMLARGDEDDVAFWEEHGIHEAIAACLDH